MDPSTLAIRRTIQFKVHSRVELAQLEGMSGVCGQWAPDRTKVIVIGRGGSLLARFANWSPEPKDVLDFTKRYGPLEHAFEKGGCFHFSLTRWRELQGAFQMLWEERVPRVGMRVPNSFGEVMDTTQGERFEFDFSGDSSYVFSCLYRMLVFGVRTGLRDRLGKCEHPHCKRSYFIARRTDQKYCSASCANWAQKQAKRNWWNTKGKVNRAGRKIVADAEI